MPFIDHRGLIELAGLDVQFVLQAAILLSAALLLASLAMQRFGGNPRPGFILTALLVPVYLLAAFL